MTSKKCLEDTSWDVHDLGAHSEEDLGGLVLREDARERRSGPNPRSRLGEWLVLGEFSEVFPGDGDDDDEFPERGQPWLWWVHEDDLFRCY